MRVFIYHIYYFANNYSLFSIIYLNIGIISLLFLQNSRKLIFMLYIIHIILILYCLILIYNYYIVYFLYLCYILFDIFTIFYQK